MTYAPTIALLQSTALAAGAGSFWYGKQAQQDIDYNSPFPQAHLYLMPAPLEGEYVKYQVLICFYGKDEHENAANLAQGLANDQDTPEGSLAIQDAMDVLSQQFFALLREEPDLDVSARIDRAPVLRKGAAIGTGFLCSFTLTSPALC